MAKYNCIPPVTGTIDDMCIYKMYDRYYLRSRSSLTGERVKKDPAFRKTMYFASLMARASAIGSALYASLPADGKQHAMYRKLTGEAMTWLKYGWEDKDVLDWMKQRYAGSDALSLFPSTATTPETEEEEEEQFLKRNNRRLLRALRREDEAVMEYLFSG